MGSKEAIERAVAARTFSMARVRGHVTNSNDVVGQRLQQLAKTTAASLSAAEGRWLADGLIRFAFLIEPVNSEVTSTKFSARWTPKPGGTTFAAFNAQDARFASFDECCAMLDYLVDLASDDDVLDIVRLVAPSGNSAVPYELPIDYQDLDRPRVHAPDNIVVMPKEVKMAVRLRTALLRRELDSGKQSLGDRDRAVLAHAFTKIKTKAYLTDRAQTGINKTNREKRWEVVPLGVQRATRRACASVEHRLWTQICCFAGFPKVMAEQLAADGLIDPSATTGLCPVTLEQFDYEAFAAECLTRVQGHSAHHVGHLHPLKAGGAAEAIGHVGENVSWVSADGNRIQGTWSIEETVHKIIEISRRHQEQLAVGADPVR